MIIDYEAHECVLAIFAGEFVEFSQQWFRVLLNNIREYTENTYFTI